MVCWCLTVLKLTSDSCILALALPWVRVYGREFGLVQFLRRTELEGYFYGNIVVMLVLERDELRPGQISTNLLNSVKLLTIDYATEGRSAIPDFFEI